MRKSIPGGILLALTVSLAGCSSSLQDAYVLEERIPALAAGAEGAGYYAESFAEDLCVVTDESAFDEGLVTSEAAALFDEDGREVLYSKDAFERLYPASITKVMTALVALEYGNLSDQVTVTEDAVITESGATLCGIEPGDVLTLEQLLYGLMLPSGNDAGAAIAVHIAGSIEAFADMMNAEADRIGAVDTHFVNPHGLHDPDHYTTAYDLYLIFKEVVKHNEYFDIASKASSYIEYKNASGNLQAYDMSSTDEYLTGEYALPNQISLVGGKTGTTTEAGACLVLLTENKDGDDYISIVLKADNHPALYKTMNQVISKENK